MQFRTIILALAGLAAVYADDDAKVCGGGSSGSSSSSSTVVVKNIKTVTTLSSQTNDIFTSISPFNIFTSGIQAVNNLRQIVTIVTSDIQMMSSPEAKSTTYAVQDQQQICDAFRDFVHVHQALLATVISKRSIFAQTPFTAPVAAVLRAIEGGVDTLAFSLINVVPSCAAGATQDKNALDSSLQQSITVYSS